MRRTLALLVCLLAVASLAAQESPRFRTRWGARVLVGGALAPRVTITEPTLDPSFTVNSATITLRGSAESTSGAPIDAVEWENQTTAATGTAAGTLTWQTEGSSSSATVGLDTFQSVNTVALASTFADTTGGAWTAGPTSEEAVYVARRLAGYANPNTSRTSGGSPHAFALAAPSPAITSNNYDVSVKLVEWFSIGADDGSAIIFGYQDANNYCAVFWYGSSATTDAYILKRVGGVLTTLDSDNIDPANGDTITIEARGQGLTVKRTTSAGVTTTVLTATDSTGAYTCDDDNGVGIAFGALRDVPTDDFTTSLKLDDFTVVDQDAGGTALTLAEGENVIVVTACDTQAVPVCGTDTIRITYATADTVDPLPTILTPTSNPAQNTSTSAITVTGTCTDNTAPTSVTVNCPTCTPAAPSNTGTAAAFEFIFTAQTAGANTITVTCADAAANDATDVLTSTYTAADATAPVLTITSNGGSNFSTTTNPFTLIGTATDAVGVTAVSCLNASGSTGAATFIAGPSVQWSVPVTLALGTNTVSCTATDEASNTSAADSIVITRTATLTVTTVSMPNGRVGDAYPGVQMAASGGTPPYTWTNNGAGTSLNDSDAQCAGIVVSSAGVPSGTPTTDGQCCWTPKVTDDAAATDTSDSPICFTIATAGAEGPHDYFNSLLIDSNCWKAFSLRPLTGQTTAVTTCAQSRWEKQLMQNNSNGLYTVRPVMTTTYCPTGSEYAPSCPSVDTDPQKQDAAKIALPMWVTSDNVTLAAPIDATTLQIPISGTIGKVTGDGGGIKIGDEILYITGLSDQSGTNITVTVTQRGAFGTGPSPGVGVSHSAGEAVLRNTNINPTTAQIALNAITDPTETRTYLFTWDTFHTDSFIANRHGLQVHKTIKFLARSNVDDWFRADGAYAPEATENVTGVFDRTQHVGTLRGRRLPSMTHPPAIHNEPHQPMLPIANGSSPIIKPNVWGRWWVQLDLKAEGVAANYTDMTGALLKTAMTTAPAAGTEENITISCPGGENVASFGPGCWAFTTAAAISCCSGTPTWPGRSLRIGTEIMTIKGPTSTTQSETREITVVRGAYGTTPATHALNAQIQLVTDDISMWYADENTDPVQVLDKWPHFLPENSSTVAARGALKWVLIEYSTSTDKIFQERVTNESGGQQDLVVYLRNFAFLRYSGIITSADWSSLRVKPVR